MTLTNKKIAGFTLILYGVSSLLSYYSIVSISPDILLGSAFILFGLPSAYISFNDNRRDLLLLSTVLFMMGIIFLVKSNYEIINTRGIVFTSILFIGGTTFLVLFIDNTKEKTFLYTSFVLLALGFFSITLLREMGILDYANKIADLAEDFWPVVLIVFGLNIFWNRNK